MALLILDFQKKIHLKVKRGHRGQTEQKVQNWKVKESMHSII